jgi:hypothetical protein
MVGSFGGGLGGLAQPWSRRKKKLNRMAVVRILARQWWGFRGPGPLKVFPISTTCGQLLV